ncbi:MAG: NAD(P)H-binding protein [Gemmatimonadetes bacterium]|uniref:NAD(P)H-binding protein n=1 Tax=Candidatus Kutchimonas denitrificans TaxID=3056748 RepID=A0AAE5CB66_9BACT|nr:NAD(P)H-binding protein [Gemmatimonadota bacterium]NIR75407.1 NAD(P)H-binding protein [Candidatus Kutchimonas denitrificans]NIS01721.1 NAD(P)H-binding protein [Gemmatimonadota bacterium]NIT67503.1 NAD(P)H-binding protein [Gemmatimonadota bacterium]NIU53366.1 NAD(P)H-binding protein [Gemmatimonadota bacterium]
MEKLDFQRAAVFGATGATGREITRELRRRGVAVRAVSRSSENLARDFGELDVEPRAADLSEREAAVGAAAGCDLVFHCVGLPADRFPLHLPLTRNTVAAMEAHGARGVLVTSYWSYGPGDDEPMPEDRTPVPGSEMARIRKEQEDVVLGAGGCVARLPDFYGPGADLSLANDALQALQAGKTVTWPGDPDARRDFVFVPDTGPVLCELASRPQAYGGPWNVPGSGAETPRTILECGARILGAELKLRRGRRWMLELAALFNRQIRGFRDVFPLYERPLILDTTRIRELLGDLHLTSYEDGIRQYFAWLEDERS